MPIILLVIVLAFLVPQPSLANEPSWFKESFLDLREDVAEAAENDKRVMLYFHQDGCPYCAKLLQDNFADRAIADLSQRKFEVIALNLWGDREVTDLQGETVTEKQFAESLRVQYTPTLIFLDEQGKVVSRINGYFPPHKFKLALEYVAGKHEKEMRLGDYIAQASPVAASGKLHHSNAFVAAPFDFKENRKNANKPLLVFFEQKQCAACDELHEDAFKRPEVAVSLSDFDLALIDIRAPENKTWVKQQNIQYTPSMVFYDQAGKEVFRVEAYLKAFHLLSVLDYVKTRAYQYQSNFQRFIQHRADVMQALGVEPELMD